MKKLYKGFLKDEVLFVGYSSKDKVMSNSIYNAFTKSGLKVYAMSKNKDASHDVKVYNNYEDLPNIPKSAYVLLGKTNADVAVKELVDQGVKKIAMHSAKHASDKVVELCSNNGVELVAGCPMMLYGKGIHRIHGFFAGVK